MPKNKSFWGAFINKKTGSKTVKKVVISDDIFSLIEKQIR